MFLEWLKLFSSFIRFSEVEDVYICNLGLCFYFKEIRFLLEVWDIVNVCYLEEIIIKILVIAGCSLYEIRVFRL